MEPRAWLPLELFALGTLRRERDDDPHTGHRTYRLDWWNEVRISGHHDLTGAATLVRVLEHAARDPNVGVFLLEREPLVTTLEAPDSLAREPAQVQVEPLRPDRVRSDPIRLPSNRVRRTGHAAREVAELRKAIPISHQSEAELPEIEPHEVIPPCGPDAVVEVVAIDVDDRVRRRHRGFGRVHESPDPLSRGVLSAETTRTLDYRSAADRKPRVLAAHEARCVHRATPARPGGVHVVATARAALAPVAIMRV